MPASPEQLKHQGQCLKAARAKKGWSQSRLARELRAAAHRLQLEGELPDDDAPLIAYVSHFENGRRPVSDRLKPIFREALQASDRDLGFPEPGTRVLVADMTGPDDSIPVGVEVVEPLRAILAAHLSMEALVGPRYVIPAVLGHLPLIEKLCRTARGVTRDEILCFASEFTEFCGWLYQDSGDLEAAKALTDTALEYAVELDDPQITSYVLMRKSGIAIESGEPAHALGIINAALKHPKALTPRLQAVTYRQQAHAHARLREISEFEQAAEHARLAAAKISSQDQPDRAPYCTPQYVDMEIGAAWLTLRHPENALPIFEAARASWSDDAQGRDLTLCIARLAVAYAQTGNKEAAQVTTSELLQQARTVTSARVQRPLNALRRELLSWAADPLTAELVRELDEWLPPHASGRAHHRPHG